MTPRVPAAPVAAHVNDRLAEGMTRRRLAAAARVSHGVVAAIARGDNPTVSRPVARKLLAVRTPRVNGPHDRVPAHGTTRRVRALYTLGHGPQAIARRTGLTRDAIRRIAGGRQTRVTAATYLAVRDAYRHMATRPGTSSHARRVAAAGGWAGPGGIPPQPAASAPREPARADAAPARDQLRALAAAGFPVTWLAARCGVQRVCLGAIRTGRQARAHRNTLQAVDALHRELAGTTAADHGVPERDAHLARLIAARGHWTADMGEGRAAA